MSEVEGVEMMSVRKVLVGFGVAVAVLASATVNEAVALRVNVKPGNSFSYNCSYSSQWRNGEMPVDSKVSQSGQMLVKVSSKKNGIYSLENKLTGWRTVSETFRNGDSDGDLVVKSRVKDGTVSFRVDSYGKILDVAKEGDWRSALSVVLPFPTKTVQVGDRWTSALPLAPGTSASDLKVVYEVFERRKWEGFDVLVVQFSSEPVKYGKDMMTGLVYVDTKTGMTVKGQIKNILETGSSTVQVDVQLEIRK